MPIHMDLRLAAIGALSGRNRRRPVAPVRHRRHALPAMGVCRHNGRADGVSRLAAHLYPAPH